LLIDRQEGWEALNTYPVLRHQMVELMFVSSLEELAQAWCFDSPSEVQRFLRGPFLRRIRRDAEGAMALAMERFGELAI